MAKKIQQRENKDTLTEHEHISQLVMIIRNINNNKNKYGIVSFFSLEKRK